MADSFLASLQGYIEQAKENSCEGAVLVVDVTNLHNVMEVFGTEFAHRLLAELRKELIESIQNDVQVHVAQHGYIYIVFPKVTSSELGEHADNIHRFVRSYCCKKPFESSQLVLVSSLGSAMFPSHGDHAQDILDKAYISVKYTENESETIYYSYEKTRRHLDALESELALAHTLQSAVLDRKIHLAFQPIIDAKTGKASHYETLLRLVDQEHHIISAGPYIPISEKLGFIDIVDEVVLEMVIDEMIQSHEARLSLNISTLGIDNPHWFAKLSKALKAHPEIASNLMIEITETAAQRDLGRTAYFVAQLQDMGCRVALDDFGAGNTSIRQLKSLSIDVVKIDGSLIRNIVTNKDNQIFVEMLVDMSRKFGMETIAECIENGETARYLMDMGVDKFQGNYFGAPLIHRPWYGSEPYKYDG